MKLTNKTVIIIEGCDSIGGEISKEIHRQGANVAHLSKSQAVDYSNDSIRVNLLRLGHIWSAPLDELTKSNRNHANA